MTREWMSPTRSCPFDSEKIQRPAGSTAISPMPTVTPPGLFPGALPFEFAPPSMQAPAIARAARQISVRFMAWPYNPAFVNGERERARGRWRDASVFFCERFCPLGQYLNHRMEQ